MRQLLDRVFNAVGYLAGIFMVGTLLAVLISIAGRLVPALDLPGADAYAGYCMACSAFLALAPTLRRGEHIRVTLLLNLLPQTPRKTLDILCHVVAIGIAGALAWYSIRLVMQSREFFDISTGLDATPLWIPQLGMALGTSLLVLAFAGDLILLLRGEALRDESSDNEPVRVE
ncbi:TRAP transporter small permease [Rhodoferax sp.]|uniref:TRAP transporter small permease n=1 Tax=Rhodoferax sp. TaxID=50421 RepID=UPI00261BBD95|nr:TRAP transporter small permease [Rhodoferax sp.]MDD3935890.1 TRAP transporter small permease [Rhodoferax sp.]